MRYALLDHQLVTNVILHADVITQWGGLQAVHVADNSPVSPGWTYDGTNWTSPVVVTPDPAPDPADISATLDQAALALQKPAITAADVATVMAAAIGALQDVLTIATATP